MRQGLAPYWVLAERRGVLAYLLLRVAEWRSRTTLRRDGLEVSADDYEIIDAPAISGGCSLRFYVGRTELFVANTQSRMISVISMVSGKVTADIDAGIKGCRAIVFSPDGSAAFATIEDSSEVIAIDTVARAVIRRIDVGPSPRGIALDASNADALRLYISCFTRTTPKTTPAGYTFAPNSLTVVDLPMLANLPTGSMRYSNVSVGAGPCSAAILQTRAIEAST